jgi:hypothetical protein
MRRILGRPTHKCVEIFNVDLKEKGCEHMDWIHLPQDRIQWLYLVNSVTKHRVPQIEGEFLNGLSDHQLLKETLLYGVL